MNNRNRSMALLLITTVLTIAMFIYSNSAISKVAAQDASSISLVTQTNTDAGVRRAGWSGFSKLSLGASIESGDLIDPKGKPVRVLCANLTEQVITDIGPVPCPKERAVLVQEGLALAGWQRSRPQDITVPFLISPRATAVTSAQPLIMWNALLDTDGYKITVRGEGVDWSTEVKGAANDKLNYPKDAPPLTPDNKYTVEIVAVGGTADGRSSSEEDTPGMSFTVLAPTDFQPIKKAKDLIRTRVHDKVLADLTIAHFYAQNGLNAEALQLLLNITGDPLVAPKNTPKGLIASPVLYLKLGDLCIESRLDIYAAAAYNRALDLAKQNDDTESAANALLGLARLSSDSKQQLEYANEALKDWQTLGAIQQVEAVQQEFKGSGS
ncbi:MAG: fibronectin type III domain-containing protein [Chloroflexota bacterium]